MTTKRIVWTRADGGLSVTTPAPASQLPGESEGDWLARIAVQVVPQGISHRIAEAATLPATRRFRNAWQDTGAAVVVGMVKARLLRKAELLALRKLRLEAKTEALERAVDNGQTALAALLRADRVALRNLDDTLDGSLGALTTPEQLEGFTPPELA